MSHFTSSDRRCWTGVAGAAANSKSQRPAVYFHTYCGSSYCRATFEKGNLKFARHMYHAEEQPTASYSNFCGFDCFGTTEAFYRSSHSHSHSLYSHLQPWLSTACSLSLAMAAGWGTIGSS